MPFGLLFKSIGLRVGHYGPKVGAALFGHHPDPWMPAVLLVQHFVIGWLSAMPLLMFWLWRAPRAIQLGDGLLYGLAYYLAAPVSGSYFKTCRRSVHTHEATALKRIPSTHVRQVLAGTGVDA